MKVLAINGSPHEHGTTYAALQETCGQLNQSGVETKILWIGKDVPGCIGCGGCKGKGKCAAYDDIVNQVIDEIPEYDGFLFGSPVYFGGIAGAMKCFMDRLFYTGSHFEFKVGSCICVLRRSGGVTTFHEMLNYLHLARMVLPPSRYWLAAHGHNGEELLEDQEGRQVLREMASSMAWVMESLKKADLPKPIPEEKRLNTNFIKKH